MGRVLSGWKVARSQPPASVKYWPSGHCLQVDLSNHSRASPGVERIKDLEGKRGWLPRKIFGQVVIDY